MKHGPKTETLTRAILQIPGRLPSWNQWWSGKHWSERSRLKESWAKLIWAAAMNGGMQHSRLQLPIWVRVIQWHERGNHRVLDADNLCAKLVVDGIKRVGLIPDDDPSCVKAVTTSSQMAGHDWVQVDLVTFHATLEVLMSEVVPTPDSKLAKMGILPPGRLADPPGLP